MLLPVVLLFLGASALVIHQLVVRLPRVQGLCLGCLVATVAALPILAIVPVVSESAAPTDFRRNEYCTSQTCRNCHEDHYKSWHGTWHRTMTQEVSPPAVLGKFDGAAMTVAGYPCRTFRKGDRFFMTVVDPVWEKQRVDTGIGPERLTTPPPTVVYSVDRLVGSHHQQVYLTKRPDGTYQTLPLVWLKKQKRWTTRGASFLSSDTGSFYDKTKIWNNGCIFCHNTRGRPGLQEHQVSTNLSHYTWNSRVEELGIACEACHGSGETHVTLNQNPVRRYWLSQTEDRDSTIVNPATLSKEQSVLTCSRCHGKMQAKPEFDRACLVEGDFFQPGDWTSFDRYDCPSLEPVGGFDESTDGNYFWPDGTPRTTALEYQGVVLSPCYQKGEMTCLSCHSMHNSDPDDQLLYGDDVKLPIDHQNRACVQCHNEFSDANNLLKHTHHAADSAGSLCYNCHMPYQAYSLLKKVRSHRISVPNVANTAASGIPNACNQCHVDKSLDWTNGKMEEMYGHTPTKLAERQKTVSAVVLDALSGHALQRALAVEQLGAEETLETASVDWRPAVLIDCLDDPYAAVRLIAFESLAKFRGFEDFSFDYIGLPGVRREQQERARTILKSTQTSVVTTELARILGVTNPEDAAERINELKGARNAVKIHVLE